MKKLIPLLILALSIFSRSNSYAQTTFFSDNFETGTVDTSKWSHNTTNIPNRNTSLVQDNSTLGPSGQWSAQQIYRAGTRDAGRVGWLNLGKEVLPSHFLVEFDFKLSPNFHFPMYHKWWRSQPDMSKMSSGNDTELTNNINGGQSLIMYVFSYSRAQGYREWILTGSAGGQIQRNVWHRIGYRYKKNTFNGSAPNHDGEIEMFFNGKSVGRRADVRLIADPARWFSDYWGGPGTYTSVNNPIPADQWIRVDNFKITDLGGGPVPTSTPVPPTPTPTPTPPSGPKPE